MKYFDYLAAILRRLWDRRIDALPRSTSGRRLTGPPFFSPDGSVISNILGLLDLRSMVSGGSQSAVDSEIGRRVRELSLREIIQLDGRMRTLLGRYGPWSRLQTGDLMRLGSGASGHELLCLATQHADGHIRQAAVEYLSDSEDCSELPFLVIRLNDHVREVRSAARDACLRRLTTVHAPAIVECLPMLLNLRRGNEWQRREIADAARAAVTDGAAIEHVLHAILGGNPDVSNACFSLYPLRDSEQSDLLLHNALESRNRTLRLRAIRALGSLRTRLGGRRVLEDRLRDNYPAVRCEALRILQRDFPDEAEERFRAGLFDRAWVVRRLCRFHLGNDFGVDPAALYAAYDPGDGADPQTIFAWIMGLVESGIQGPAERIEAEIGHPSALVRRAVVEYVGKFFGPDGRELYLERILDRSGRVRKAALRQGLTHKINLNLEEFRELLSEDLPTHQVAHVIGLLRLLPLWDQPTGLIPLLSTDDPERRRMVTDYWDAWDERSRRAPARPDSTRRQRLLETVERYRDSLPDTLVKELLFAMGDG